jgi:hypothetical protein
MVRRKMTVTERRILREVIEKGDWSGIDTNSVMKKKHVADAFKEALEKLGFTEEQLAENLLKLTRAQKIQFFQNKGVVIEEKITADNSIRLAANKLIGEWFGIPQNINVNHSGIIGSYDALDQLSDAELDQIISGRDEAAGTQD